MAVPVDPRTTSRAQAFALWMQAPMPMVTLFKTLDVTRLTRAARRRGWKLNMLLCWCIGRAAAQVKEFYLLPVGEQLMQYEKLAVNVVVALPDGSIQTCDVPVCASLEQFAADYDRLTAQVRDSGQPWEAGEEYMVIGTSALPQCEIDGAVNIYAGVYNNPFLIWGRVRRHWWKSTLPVSFQFHHTQMDGGEAAQFLAELQCQIDGLR